MPEISYGIFFSFEYDKNDPHPLFKDISIEAKERFAHGKKNEKIMLPIIPDVRKKIYESDSPFSYTVPDFPTLNTEMYNKYKKTFKKEDQGHDQKRIKTKNVCKANSPKIVFTAYKFHNYSYL
jgi:hypothetical protein